MSPIDMVRVLVADDEGFLGRGGGGRSEEAELDPFITRILSGEGEFPLTIPCCAAAAAAAADD
jgi:hypothetical protein